MVEWGRRRRRRRRRSIVVAVAVAAAVAVVIAAGSRGAAAHVLPPEGASSRNPSTAVSTFVFRFVPLVSPVLLVPGIAPRIDQRCCPSDSAQEAEAAGSEARRRAGAGGSSDGGGDVELLFGCAVYVVALSKGRDDKARATTTTRRRRRRRNNHGGGNGERGRSSSGGGNDDDDDDPPARRESLRASRGGPVAVAFPVSPRLWTLCCSAPRRPRLRARAVHHSGDGVSRSGRRCSGRSEYRRCGRGGAAAAAAVARGSAIVTAGTDVPLVLFFVGVLSGSCGCLADGGGSGGVGVGGGFRVGWRGDALRRCCAPRSARPLVEDSGGGGGSCSSGGSGGDGSGGSGRLLLEGASPRGRAHHSSCSSAGLAPALVSMCQTWGHRRLRWQWSGGGCGCYSGPS